MATTSIFVAAAATDWLDGYIARRVCNPLYSRLLFSLAGIPFKLVIRHSSLVCKVDMSDWLQGYRFEICWDSPAQVRTLL